MPQVGASFAAFGDEVRKFRTALLYISHNLPRLHVLRLFLRCRWSRKRQKHICRMRSSCKSRLNWKMWSLPSKLTATLWIM